MKTDELRLWRTARGLTQQQLAELLGVHRVTIADWERGQGSEKIMRSRMLDYALRWLDNVGVISQDDQRVAAMRDDKNENVSAH